MKLSLNQIKSYQNQYKWSGDVLDIGVDKLVEKIGSQLGAVEDVNYLGNKYQGIVIVKVVEVQKHPNADKLSLCKVDDGGITKDVTRDENGYVQVVCGAPNVRKDLMAAWLQPGSVVPDSIGKDPFILEAREIRGKVSNGMLASPKELAMGDSRDGILEIDNDQKPGADFAEVYNLKDEVIIDIENKMFTHRPDCFGLIGLARELAGIEGKAFKSPDWYSVNPKIPEIETEELKLEVKNELPSLVPRFCAITIRDIKIGPSPLWLQFDLIRLGVRPINNVVDLTNYYMLFTGQPIHAYDYDKVKSFSGKDYAGIVIRNPKPGEKILLLNGKEIEPRPEAMMVATENKLICVGGAMGGQETEVSEFTTNVIIEAANWDMYEMRRTIMEHGLFTDAATRFTKGQSPIQNLAVITKIVEDIKRIAGGKVASQVADNNHLSETIKERNSIHPPVTITNNFIRVRLGIDITDDQIKTILENVEFRVNLNGDEIVVTAPFWRTDIELREDVVEEVGRLYGYDKLPLNLPLRDLAPAVKDPILEAKNEIRSRLSREGANELLTYSFVHGDLFKKVGQNKAKAFQVANAISPDLQYYRLSLVPSLLEKVHPNLKAGYDKIALFELGKTHSLDQVEDDGLPKEFEYTALVVAIADKLKSPGSAYYLAQKYLRELCGLDLSFKSVDEGMTKYPVTQPYDRNRSALVSVKSTGEFLGIIGEFKPSVTRNLKLPKYTAGFEVDTEVLNKIFESTLSYKQLPRFPKVNQDISLKVPSDVSYQDLFDVLFEGIEETKPAQTLAQLEPLDIYQSDDNKEHKNITFRLSIASYERTLTDVEVNKLLDEVAVKTKGKFGAVRV